MASPTDGQTEAGADSPAQSAMEGTVLETQPHEPGGEAGDLSGCITMLLSQIVPWIVFASVCVLLVALAAGYLAGRFAPAGGAALAFFGGFLCYRLRNRKRMLYGCIEVAVGVLIAGFSVWNASKRQVLTPIEFLSKADGLIVIVAMASAIFMVVRGLDNYHLGLAKWGQKPPEKEGCQATGLVWALAFIVVLAATAGLVAGFLDRR